MHIVLCALWMLWQQWRYYLFLPLIIWSLFGSLAKSCITTVSSSAAVIMNSIIILFVPAQHKVLKKICLVWWMYYVVVLCVCVCVFSVLCLNCVQIARSVASVVLWIFKGKKHSLSVFFKLLQVLQYCMMEEISAWKMYWTVTFILLQLNSEIIMQYKCLFVWYLL